MTAHRQEFSAQYIASAARVLDILSHETRLEIVLFLAQGEASVSELSDALERPQSNVSHHLRILRDAALIENRREGQFVIYRVNIDAWTEIAEGFFDHLLEGEDEVTLQHFHIRRLPAGDPRRPGEVPPEDGDGR